MGFNYGGCFSRGYLIPGDTNVGLPGTELEAGQGRVLGRLSVHKFPFGGVNPSSPDKEGNIQRETGLGLAICKGIVEYYQGSIRADSIPGQGSTFTIFLPVRNPAGRCDEYIGLGV